MFVLAALLVLGPACFSQQSGAKVYKIGDKGPAGGLVFYDKGSASDGWRYLEAAPSDQGVNVQWYKNKNIHIKTSTDIGTGKANTDAIIAAQGTGTYAAALCRNLNLGGYTDWFLPSRDELKLMYVNLKLKGLGGFSGAWFWSSSQFTSRTAWGQEFSDGYQYDDGKYTKDSVRACRAF
jgi:hypothetical protein